MSVTDAPQITAAPQETSTPIFPREARCGLDELAPVSYTHLDVYKRQITDSVWEPIAPSGPHIRKQLKLYRKNVAGHVQELGKLEGRARRQNLESNAEAIVFDTYALLSSLKTHAEYQAVRAALARTRSANDESEAQLFERITRNTPVEINESLSEILSLIHTYRPEGRPR